MFSKGNKSKEFIRLNDFEVIEYYFDIIRIPTVIKSPIREDNHPSLGLYSRDGESIYYTDFSTGDRGSIYDLLSKMWNLSRSETFEKIKEDLHLNTKPIFTQKKIEYKKLNDTKLECKTRNWRKYDLDYWNSFGISKEWLDFAEVYPISHKILIKDGQRYVFPAEKLAYAFAEHKDNKTTLKIYQPELKSNEGKWINKHDSSVISLWTKIPEKGNRLIICSSLKDALCLWSNTGIPAIAPQGEGYSLSNTAISELKKRFKKIYILFDNDTAGIQDSEKLSQSTGFESLEIPQFDGGKDVSDYYKLNGKTKFINLIKNLLNGKKNHFCNY